MAGPTWRNWARTVAVRPARFLRPATVDELAAAVADAAADGLRVKAVGSGHSFTDIAATDGLLLDLSRLNSLVSADTRTGLVTVEGGIPLHRLNQVLDSVGLAMPNLGDIDRQTLAGAVSTGTHGTGAGHPGLAAQIRALDLVLPDGSVVSCSPEQRPELFEAARLGLGAVGVLARITLECVPAFLLHAEERPMPLDAVLSELWAMAESNDHFEFYWFPHTNRTLTKCNNRVPPDRAPEPLSRLRAWWDDEFLSNRVFEGVNRLATTAPRLTPALAEVSARALGARTFTDASHRVFCSPRRVVFREAEFALPREELPEVLQEVRRWIDRSGERLPFPVEVRFAAADEVWLSTAHGRDSAYVAVHQYHRLPHERYFAAVQEIAIAHGGRPHWGKLHTLDAAALADRYPRWADFQAVRREADPDGRFANPYLDRVLGPLPASAAAPVSPSGADAGSAAPRSGAADVT